MYKGTTLRPMGTGPDCAMFLYPKTEIHNHQGAQSGSERVKPSL